ncbi:MAG TPA: hypothetical protein EYG86_06820 [Crocinitomicaceae bacterium]|nr:hypothetical protein [Crocinitomicaceae bacterium]
MSHSNNQFNYHLYSEDYLTFQLYTASKSEVVAKKRKSEWMLLWFLPLVFGLYFLTSAEYLLATYFFIVTIVTFFFYSQYFKWRYKKRHLKFILANYQEHFGAEEELVFNADHLFLKNKTGEGKVLLDAVISCVEIPSHLFIKLNTGTSIILPKTEVDEEAVKTQLTQLKINVEHEVNWAW